MNCNQTKSIDVQGHRGCRGLLPENSNEGFRKAIELGVNVIELDVVVSKDNIVVVSHEPFMSGTICLDTNGNEIPHEDQKKYNLYEMTFDSIKQFDCGTKKHSRFSKQEKFKTYKPSLDEVIKSAKQLNPNIKFNIELKARSEYDGIFTPLPKDFVKLVLAVVNVNDSYKETNLQSFDLRILEEVKQQSPKMKVSLLVDGDEDIWNKMNSLSFLPEIISPYYKLLDAKTVRNLQAENFMIIPWTVNSIKDMNQMINFQVDGIITDYPDMLIELIKEY